MRDEGVEDRDRKMEAPGFLTVNKVTGSQTGLRAQLIRNWQASTNVGPDSKLTSGKPT